MQENIPPTKSQEQIREARPPDLSPLEKTEEAKALKMRLDIVLERLQIQQERLDRLRFMEDSFVLGEAKKFFCSELYEFVRRIHPIICGPMEGNTEYNMYQNSLIQKAKIIRKKTDELERNVQISGLEARIQTLRDYLKNVTNTYNLLKLFPKKPITPKSFSTAEVSYLETMYITNLAAEEYAIQALYLSLVEAYAKLIEYLRTEISIWDIMALELKDNKSEKKFIAEGDVRESEHAWFFVVSELRNIKSRMNIITKRLQANSMLIRYSQKSEG